MTRYVAFLRGLNVGGHRLTNAELAAVFADAGMDGVHTFLASGNVVFDAGADGETELAGRLEEQLETTFGYAVPTLLRSAGEALDVASRDPFEPDALAASTGKPQVLFLRTPPEPDVAEEITALAPVGEHLVVVGREVHWLPAAGISVSELDQARLGRLVGVGTMRTHNTVTRLAAKYLDA